MAIETAWGSATDIGVVRTVNEDAVLTAPPVFVVADGMGGHVRGDLASRAAVTAFEHLASVLRAEGRAAGAEDIGATIHDARRDIEATTRQSGAGAHEGRPGAGTTVAGVVLTEHDGAPAWLAFNIGDSRIYRFSEAGLVQVSVDHSLVQELVDAGAIEAAQARHHPRRNVITRAVGAGPEADPDLWWLPAIAGDLLLLCSDGLTDEIEDHEIAEELASATGPQQAAERLVARAVASGAQDNVSAIVVRAETADSPA